MLQTTLTAAAAMLRADPTLTTADRGRLLKLLRRDGREPEPPAAAPEERIVRRAEAGRLLSVTLRAIDAWAAAGILPRVRLPGRRRGLGFRLRDIIGIMEGRSAAILDSSEVGEKDVGN
jgi:hypothetical protein